MENSSSSETFDTQATHAKQRLKDGLRSISEMKSIEDLIKSKFSSDANDLTEISNYLHELGGKRMRPALCVLVAKALKLEPLPQELLEVAAGIELIHMATLLHDDIIDKSELRRHQESAFIRYGTAKTLLAGDFLLVRAFSLCAHLDDTIIEATERACIELTEGEILEIPLYEKLASVEDSLTIARKKTAALFALASFSAAHIAKLDDTAKELFRDFGYSLGIAFQILDDILDVTSSAEVLGKKAGIDIRERKPSIVNVLWLQSDSELAKKMLTPPSRTEADEDSFIDQSLAEIKASTVINQARELAESYAIRAREKINQATSKAPEIDPIAISVIEAFIDYTLERLK